MNISPAPVSCVVVDAFGTLAYLSAPRRPYARLRAILQSHGCHTDDFACLAMTQSLGFGALAEHYGVELSMAQIEALECLLEEDLESIRIENSVPSSLRLLSQYYRVVIGSNLARPYGMMLRQLLRMGGVEVGRNALEGEVGAHFSYERGVLKPDPLFYQGVSRSIGVDPTSIIMVGDKRAEDYEGPVSQGWRALSPQRRAGPECMGVWPDVVRQLLAAGGH